MAHGTTRIAGRTPPLSRIQTYPFPDNGGNPVRGYFGKAFTLAAHEGTSLSCSPLRFQLSGALCRQTLGRYFPQSVHFSYCRYYNSGRARLSIADQQFLRSLEKLLHLPAQHHARSPTPSTGQPFCHRTSVRSGSRADSAWSPAAAGEIPLYEAASFDIGCG